MAHDTAVRYSEEVTQAQLDELTRGVTFSVQKGLDYVRWTCPRCGAEFEQSFRRDDPIYKFDVETADAPSDHGVLDLVCKCGVKHDGADDKPGCGFAAHLPVKKA